MESWTAKLIQLRLQTMKGHASSSSGRALLVAAGAVVVEAVEAVRVGFYLFHFKDLMSGIGGARGSGDKAPRGTYPPYIHFTMQKTNRDTQDALSHLSRMLRVSAKDLSVAGTKDKRAVTTQRVSLKRNGKSVEDVWDLANGQKGRRTLQEALSQRGERGVRIADLNYRKASLELGMLKGNVFVITLR